MNKKGVTTIEVLMWLVAGVSAAITYAHSTFTTYREIVPRLDRIETKLDCSLGIKDSCK